MKTWKDYVVALPDGQSYSKRITSSGHITVSALVTLEGKLEAFPPRAGKKAFPVFITLDASSRGRIGETSQGKFPQKGWNLSSTTHKGRGRLMNIFMDLYKEIHLSPLEIPLEIPEEKNVSRKAQSLFEEGWRYWKNDREVVFNNLSVGGVSWPTEEVDQEQNFSDRVFTLVGEKFEDLEEVLKILSQMTVEAGY